MASQPASWPPQTFLGMLEEKAREDFLGLGMAREYLPDRTLIREGDLSTRVTALIDGWAKVLGSTGEGRQALLSLRTGGDLVGEQAALDNAPRSATVISASLAVVRELTQDEFQGFLERWPRASVAVSCGLSAELRWATRRRIDFSGLSVLKRLSRVISELGRLYGEQAPEGHIELLCTLTQPDLAAMVGASEPAVHKALGQLRRNGVVKTGYRRLVITNPAALDAGILQLSTVP